MYVVYISVFSTSLHRAFSRYAGAAWAALEYPDADIRCITFGSPRVANKVFGKAFNALVGTSLRLVHGFDPIPSLPPSLM